MGEGPRATPGDTEKVPRGHSGFIVLWPPDHKDPVLPPGARLDGGDIPTTGDATVVLRVDFIRQVSINLSSLSDLSSLASTEPGDKTWGATLGITLVPVYVDSKVLLLTSFV